MNVEHAVRCKSNQAENKSGRRVAWTVAEMIGSSREVMTSIALQTLTD